MKNLTSAGLILGSRAPTNTMNAPKYLKPFLYDPIDP